MRGICKMKNAVNREIPDYLLQGGKEVFRGSNYRDGASFKKAPSLGRIRTSPVDSKVLPSIRDAIQAVNFRDGMTVSFHHHFREGDFVVNMVMKEIVAMGFRDITIAASSLGQAHDPVAEYIEQGSVTGIQTSGIRGRMGEVVSHGKLRTPAILRSHGFENFLIQSGGDMYVGGHPEGRAWRLGIQDPRGTADTPFAVVELTNATFSTSGDYERFFVKDGRRYHHILDPDSGEPAMASRSVTIVTSRAVDADALSTAVFILGPEAGMALIEQLPDVEGVIVGARNEVRVSSGLKDRLTVLSPPADGP